MVEKWRAIQNKTTNPYIIEIACDFSRPGVRPPSPLASAQPLSQAKFDTPHDSVRPPSLRDRSIVVGSRRS
jgi:hypothetical protein